MKVLIYFEGQQLLSKSGIGRAFDHQKKALESAGVPYSTDENELDYDILHINTYGLNSQRMVRRAKRADKKVIYHAHSTEEDFRNSFIGSNQVSAIYKKHLVRLYSSADFIITPTLYSKKVIEGYGIEQPIEAISNGIDLTRFNRNVEKEKQFRDYFQLPLDKKVIISVGLYFERKGLVDFVEVARRFPEYTFIWFGHTPLYTIPKKIRAIIQGDHPDNVIFPGYIKGDIIEGAYTNADLFFFPSYEETEGIVVLEALASRQHVLVREIPVYDGWLVPGENAYMGRTNEDFCNQIEQIIEKKAIDLRENGWQTAQGKSIQAIGQQLKSVYEKVLGN
ncbi:MAG: glycosyltransferase family 4 protein [Enterococcus sp.]|nr:glycosyltransferase family 4 protein [Enterococcus sp.]MBP8692925.1 glycosyltransferase family 4 protein [Enterococcus sp.]MBP9521586.1 glycosyltransferase family 4 protein [Enterococcus sp.]MBP9639085.1 glycosyltransferase family 4 protein [Enterococcus sp.]HRM23987.1 glycosyltransferase family 4 protein [Enterococcus aquimarinus]